MDQETMAEQFYDECDAEEEERLQDLKRMGFSREAEVSGPEARAMRVEGLFD